MADEIVELIRKLIESLFVLLDGRPAWESIRNAFGLGGAEGSEFVPSIVIFSIAAILGVSAFLLFLFLMKRGERRKKKRLKKYLAVQGSRK